MFVQGSLIYIEDFDFTIINPSLKKLNNLRDKYLLVLDNYGNNSSLFCCFTTTLRNEKAFHKVAVEGCNKNHFQYNVFHFKHGDCVTDASFVFPELTFIAGNKGQIFDLDMVTLYQKFKLNSKIHNKGVLSKELFFNVIHCLHLSKTLEQDMKEDLFEIGNSVMEEIQKMNGQA